MRFRNLFKAMTRVSCGGSAGQRRWPAASRLQVEALEHRFLPTSYSAALLPSPEGTFRAGAVDINAAGTVVGWAAPESHVRRALLWDDGAMIELGTLGGNYSTAYALNDHGQVVGWATRPDDSATGFLINPEDTDGDGAPDLWFRDANGDGANDLMVEIPVGEDINNFGQVVGGRFLWTPDVPNGTAGTLTDLGPGVYATDINDFGQVAGYRSDGVGGEAQAILWHNGMTTDLGPGQATDINASGQVTIGGGALWTPTTPNGTVGTYSSFDFSDWGGYFATLNFAGLNNAGRVVGDIILFNGDEGGGITDQNAFVSEGPKAASPLVLNPPPGFPSLDTAEAISDAGQIVGHTGGSIADWGPWQAYVLTPIRVPLISVGNAEVTEGNTGAGAAAFTVTLSEPSAVPVTVAYATADGTAVAGADYQAVSGTLTFAPGETSKSILVPINGDWTPEPNERFFVNLSGPTNAFVVDGQGVGVIVDDEPTVSITNATVTEGNTGTRSATFTVTLSSAAGVDVTVHYDTADGTAEAGSDYTAASGTVTISAGQTSATFTVAINGDRLVEPNETFAVNLSAPTNANIADGQGIGTILDDEPRISISDVTKREGRKNTTSFTFTVTLSAAYDEPVTMSFQTVNGTATTGNNDYVAKSGTLTFAPGETTKTITIEVKGDNKRESNETFYLDLFDLSSNALFTKNRGLGTILNDD